MPAITPAISEYQHGFMPGRGTHTNLAHIAHAISEALTEKNSIDIVYFDLSKAFDRLDHRIFAIKLAKLSPPYSTYKSIMQFITNRQYEIKINGKSTGKIICPPSAVPQGSHLGPIAFNIAINDIVNSIKHSSILIYADDIKLFKIIRTEEDRRQLQMDINALHQWTIDNCFAINPLKTTKLTIGKSSISTNYFIGSEPIANVTTQRDLGVYFDDSFSFKHHIQIVTGRVQQLMGIAYRISQEINNRSILLAIYNIYIRPIIEYAAPIWRHCPKKDIEMLDRFHRRITKTALNIPRKPTDENYVPYAARCLALSQMSPETRFKISCAMMIITAIQSHDNIVLNLIVRRHIAPPRRNLRRAHLFDLPHLPSKKATSIIYKNMAITETFATSIDLTKSKQTIKNNIVKQIFNI